METGKLIFMASVAIAFVAGYLCSELTWRLTIKRANELDKDEIDPYDFTGK
jgi:hypothetical protein